MARLPRGPRRLGEASRPDVWLVAKEPEMESAGSTKIVAVIVTLALCLMSIAGDYFLKTASRQPSPFATKEFVTGFTIYALTSIVWMKLMTQLKLATMGVLYCVGMII